MKKLRIGALLAAGLMALSFAGTASAAQPTDNKNHDDEGTCVSSLFSWSVAYGANAYPMLSVTVHAKDTLPRDCSFSFSLNSYTTEGPTWATSGTQALLSHVSTTLSAAKTSDTLTVEQPLCFGQTDFYIGTTAYDGKDGQLPHYQDVVTPAGLIAYSNGGAACETTTSTSTTSTDTTATSTTSTETTTTTETTTATSTTSTDTSTSSTGTTATSTDTSTSSTGTTATSTDTSTSSTGTTTDTTGTTTGTTATSTDTTGTITGAPATSTSATPSGSVLGATGTPTVTPPPTDAVGSQSGTPGTGSWMLVLAVGALASLAALVLAPARKRK